MGQHLRKRLKQEVVEHVLQAFVEHTLPEKEACALLHVHRSHLHRLARRWQREGRKGTFTLSQRRSYVTKALPEAVQAVLHKQLRYLRSEADVHRGWFNFAVLAEEATLETGHLLDRNTIRRFALRHGYYHATPEETRKVYTRFETAGPGMLFQHDSSLHRWVPGLPGYQSLLLTKDDHSRRFVQVTLVPHETSWAHLCHMRATVEAVGRPLAYYVDRHSIFRASQQDGRHVTYIRHQDQGDVQVARALALLGVDPWEASSPEAKGKVESGFKYLQHRIPYLCEKHRVRTLRGAQRVADDVTAFYNERREHEETGLIPQERWEAAPKRYLRPLPPSVSLDYVFALHYPRVVRKDGTVSFEGKSWVAGCAPGRTVTICLVPGQRFMIHLGTQKLRDYWL